MSIFSSDSYSASSSSSKRRRGEVDDNGIEIVSGDLRLYHLPTSLQSMVFVYLPLSSHHSLSLTSWYMNTIAHLRTSRVHVMVTEISVSKLCAILRYQPYLHTWEENGADVTRSDAWQNKLTLWMKEEKKYPYPVRVRTLHFRHRPLTAEAISFYTHVPMVELSLFSYRLSPEMARLDTLRILSLHNARFADLVHLPTHLEELVLECKEEEEVNLSSSTPRHVGWIHLTRSLPRLRVLRIKNFHVPWDDTWWESILGMTQLVEHHVDNVSIRSTQSYSTPPPPPPPPAVISSASTSLSGDKSLLHLRSLTFCLVGVADTITLEHWRKWSRWTPHVRELTFRGISCYSVPYISCWPHSVPDISCWTHLQKLHLYLDGFFYFDLPTVLEYKHVSLRHLKLTCVNLRVDTKPLLSLSLFVAHIGTGLTHLEVEDTYFGRNEWTLIGRGLTRLVSLSVTSCMTLETLLLLTNYFPLLQYFYHYGSFSHVSPTPHTISTTIGWLHLSYLHLDWMYLSTYDLLRTLLQYSHCTTSLRTLSTPHDSDQTPRGVLEIVKLFVPTLRHWYLAPIPSFTTEQLDSVQESGCTLHFDPLL